MIIKIYFKIKRMKYPFVENALILKPFPGEESYKRFWADSHHKTNALAVVVLTNFPTSVGVDREI